MTEYPIPGLFPEGGMEAVCAEGSPPLTTLGNSPMESLFLTTNSETGDEQGAGCATFFTDRMAEGCNTTLRNIP